RAHRRARARPHALQASPPSVHARPDRFRAAARHAGEGAARDDRGRRARARCVARGLPLLEPLSVRGRYVPRARAAARALAAAARRRLSPLAPPRRMSAPLLEVRALKKYYP